MSDIRSLIRQAEKILEAGDPELPGAELETLVSSFLSRRSSFLQLAEHHQQPVYVFDRAALEERARMLMSAFTGCLERFEAYYAVKSNNHSLVASTLLQCGFGLDVSSGVELQSAISLNAGRILFSGPGKTNHEFRLAVHHADRVTVLIDSFGELERLNAEATAQNKTVRAGVRLQSKQFGLWRKFGIRLDELTRFLKDADRSPNVKLCGLQFHTSWNLAPDRQVDFIRELGSTLAGLTYRQRQRLQFLDIGGGFWPEQGEWLQEAATRRGRLHEAISESHPSGHRHYRLPAVSIEDFAQSISRALHDHVFPHADCTIYAEPGRWLSHYAMHVMVRVVDRKADDVVITDGGTNAIGWERFESDYFPVINLSRPAVEEHTCFVFGSLCTPHDIWGYSYFGSDIQPGDVLLIPMQGAYTYSLRQHFIKAIPGVVSLEAAEIKDDTILSPGQPVRG